MTEKGDNPEITEAEINPAPQEEDLGEDLGEPNPALGEGVEPGDPAPDDGDGDVVVAIDGEEPPPEPKEESSVIKTIRQRNKDLVEANKALEKKLQSVAPTPAVEALGARPKLSDFGYEDEDEERFAVALEEWNEKKRRVDEQARTAAEAQRAEETAWNNKLASYNERKAALKGADFDDAEAGLRDVFSVQQQQYMLHVATAPELVVLALHSNEAKAKELAAITDPLLFAAAITRLETKLTVIKRTNKPAPPEGKLSGTAPKSANHDSVLARLEAEADKTGDRTKIIAHRAKMRKKD